MQMLLLTLMLGGSLGGGEGAGLPSARNDAVVPAERALRVMVRLQGLNADADAVQRQEHLDRLMSAADAPAGARLLWLRPQAAGGELARLDGVAPAQVDALLKRLSSQPGVIWLELDTRNTIGPGPVRRQSF